MEANSPDRESNEHLHLLVIGRHASILRSVTDLLDNAGYAVTGALIDDAAVEAFAAQHFDGIVIGGGVEHASRAALTATFSRTNPGITIIEVSGGPHNLLSQVDAALGRIQT